MLQKLSGGASFRPSYRSVVVLVFALFQSQMLMAQDEASSSIPTDFPPQYRHCQEALWSPPLTTLKDFVPKGHGARLSTGKLDDHVKELRCSDEQIIEYMEHHGLPYLSTIERADIAETGGGDYNRILDFCIKNRGLITRLLSGDCGGVTRFMMVDDQISYIISHGFK